jgi:hypothetical protein
MGAPARRDQSMAGMTSHTPQAPAAHATAHNPRHLTSQKTALKTTTLREQPFSHL